jgi:hypothetical protein
VYSGLASHTALLPEGYVTRGPSAGIGDSERCRSGFRADADHRSELMAIRVPDGCRSLIPGSSRSFDHDARNGDRDHSGMVSQGDVPLAITSGKLFLEFGLEERQCAHREIVPEHRSRVSEHGRSSRHRLAPQKRGWCPDPYEHDLICAPTLAMCSKPSTNSPWRSRQHRRRIQRR